MYIIIHGTEGFVGKEQEKFSELHRYSAVKRQKHGTESGCFLPFDDPI